MGWISRLFGHHEEQKAFAQAALSTAQSGTEDQTAAPIDPERVGLDGQYDQSGLAKRVALAFDQDPQVTDIDTLWVAQTGTTVVLKGKAPAADLERLVSIARGVHGAENVDISQVETV